MSLGLNIIFFDLMPCLIKENPARFHFSKYVSMINVIRIKKPKPYLKKPNRKISAKKQIKKAIKNKIYISPDIKINQNFNLPFELNPKLPKMPGTIPVHPVTKLALKNFGIKNALFAIGEVDYPPIPIFQIPPVYPISARIRGIEGWVVVRFVVDEKGRVTHVKIVKSYPKGTFDDSVINCVLKWRFKPATVEGTKVKTLVETTIRFKLQ